MSAFVVVRNSLLVSLVPAAAAVALFVGPTAVQNDAHNPPTYAQPVATAPADVRVDHNPPAY